MLFVTVGNGKFDSLVREVDRLAGEGIVRNVVIQLGHGEYKPKNCQWFAFAPSLNEYYEWADLVIGHGGPGTVFEILRRRKKLIAVPNRNRTDPRHQVEYLQAMAQETSGMIYCGQVSDLMFCLEKAKKHEFTIYEKPECQMNEVVEKFLRRQK